ncbi:hypothetical protein, partial [Citrobacter freundii]|uniref:hypothetical protein n=1 Tax=Citrobacter freundii TaxID=546 RepID=UPI0019D24F91
PACCLLSLRASTTGCDARLFELSKKRTLQFNVLTGKSYFYSVRQSLFQNVELHRGLKHA